MVEILKETFPAVTTVAILTASGVVYLNRIQAAAAMLGVDVRYFTAGDPQEIDRALSEIAAMRPDGLVVESDANLSPIGPRLLILSRDIGFPLSTEIWITSRTVGSWPTSPASSTPAPGNIRRSRPQGGQTW